MRKNNLKYLSRIGLISKNKLSHKYKIILVIVLIYQSLASEQVKSQEINYDSVMTVKKVVKDTTDSGWSYAGAGLSKVSLDKEDLRMSYSFIVNRGNRLFWQYGLQIESKFLSNDEIISIHFGRGISRVNRIGRIAAAIGPLITRINERFQKNNSNIAYSAGIIANLHANLTPFKALGLGMDIIYSVNFNHQYLGFRYSLVYEGNKKIK